MLKASTARVSSHQQVANSTAVREARAVLKDDGGLMEHAEGVKKLRPSDVKIDPNSQRPFDQKHCDKIAKEYSPLLFGEGVASLRKDGDYYVIDAQHRVRGALQAEDDTPVRYQVFKGQSLEEENDLFLRYNANKKQVSPLDTFNRSVAAGYEEHLDIVKILDRFGLQVAYGLRTGGISAVSTLMAIYSGKVLSGRQAKVPAGLPQGQLLSRTLHVLSRAWGRNRDAYDGILMRGVAGFLAKHGPQIDADLLARKLAKEGVPPQIVGRIASLRSISKKQALTAAIEVLEGIYNHKLRQKRLVDNES